MKRFYSCLLIFFLFSAAQPAFAGWVYETVSATGDQGQYASMAMDSRQRAHVAWYDATDATLNYSVREFSGWTAETVVDTGQVGKYASIAVNPATDRPAIAYFNDDANAAEYAYYDGSSWVTETIDDSDDYDRGEWISLAFSSTGIAYVSYWYDDGFWNDNGLRVAWRSSKGWTSYDLDEVTQLTNERVGLHSALIMVQNYPWIAYRTEDAFNIGQWFGWKDGTGWNSEPTINDTGLGEYSDIAVDSGENVHISSVWIRVGDDCAALIYKYAGEWSIEEIECGSDDDFGKYTSIAIDSSNTIYVAYFGNDALNLAVRANDSWELNILDDEGVTGQYTDMALDSAQSPHIVYYDLGNKDLKYVYDLPAPVLFSVNPNTGVNDAPATDVVLTGTGFHITSEVKLINPDTQEEIPCTNREADSPLEMTCDFDITGARTGLWDVYIDNPSGEFTLVDGFSVTSNPPTLDSINPASATNDQAAFAMTLTGAWFTHDMTVELKKGILPAINASSVQTNSLTSATAVFNLKNKATGVYDVTIATDWGTATLEEGFELTCAPADADFNASPKEGEAPLEVSFQDASTEYNTCEIDSWSWDFGDSGTSTEQNPTHTYTTPGKYHVTLTITSPGGDDELIEYFYIKVTEPVADDDDDDSVDDDDDAADDDDIDDDDSGDDDQTDDDDSDNPDVSDDDELGAIPEDDEGELSGGCGC